MGRPTTFSDEIAEQIVARLAEGEPLTVICRDLDVPWRTVYDWRKARPEFSAAFDHARDVGFDAIAESCIEIADTAEDPQSGKLRVWTRLQLLAKWSPKRYGEKLGLTDGEGGPLRVVINKIAGDDA